MPKIKEVWAPERIQELREARGWSRDELGQLMGVTRATIHNWETARHRPTIVQLEGLATALESHPTYFFSKTGEEAASAT